jgi:hypothetical protein
MVFRTWQVHLNGLMLVSHSGFSGVISLKEFFIKQGYPTCLASSMQSFLFFASLPLVI